MKRVLAILFLVGCAAEQPADDTAALRAAEEEVNGRLFAYPDAVKSGQTDSVMTFWSPDVQVYDQFAVIKGDSAFRRMADQFNTQFTVTRIAFAPEETIAYESGNVVYQFGYYTEDFTPRSGSGDTTNIRLNFSARWKKDGNGQWRIDRWYSVPAPRE